MASFPRCKGYAYEDANHIPLAIRWPGGINKPGRVIHDFHAGSVVPQGNPAALVEAIHTYLVDGNSWFSAQQGAIEANRQFNPDLSMGSWLKKARESVKSGTR